ncbi:MAG: hypothetical protein RIG63_25780 [Coleofasciculus chthonoplastes F3-SA18-01]|uniref:hypothetical protein n=1 Tax=Coleofasciculus chthonoplastes TaxID=64178 RepID=UPI0032FF2167
MVEEVTAFLEHEWLVIADRSQSLAGIPLHIGKQCPDLELENLWSRHCQVKPCQKVGGIP